MENTVMVAAGWVNPTWVGCLLPYPPSETWSQSGPAAPRTSCLRNLCKHYGYSPCCSHTQSPEGFLKWTDIRSKVELQLCREALLEGRFPQVEKGESSQYRFALYRRLVRPIDCGLRDRGLPLQNTFQQPSLWINQLGALCSRLCCESAHRAIQRFRFWAAQQFSQWTTRLAAMCNRSHCTQSIPLQFAGSSSETVFSFRLAKSFKYAFPHLQCALGRSGTGKGQRQPAASPRAQPFPTITAMMSVIKQAKCSSSGSEMEQNRQRFGLLPCGKDLVISFPRRRLVSAAGDFPEEIALPSPKGVTRAPEPLPLCTFHPNRTWVRPLTTNSNTQVWVSRGLRVTPDPTQLRFPQVARGLHSYRKDSIKGKKKSMVLLGNRKQELEEELTQGWVLRLLAVHDTRMGGGKGAERARTSLWNTAILFFITDSLHAERLLGFFLQLSQTGSVDTRQLAVCQL